MNNLAMQSTALSGKADELLEKNHQKLFALGLDVIFNRSTLGTKYWLPLPGAGASEHTPWSATEEHDPLLDESHMALALAFTQCQEHLVQFEKAVEADDNDNILSATESFAETVREISRMVDAHTSWYDSDSSGVGSPPPQATRVCIPELRGDTSALPHGISGPRSLVETQEGHEELDDRRCLNTLPGRTSAETKASGLSQLSERASSAVADEARLDTTRHSLVLSTSTPNFRRTAKITQDLNEPFVSGQSDVERSDVERGDPKRSDYYTPYTQSIGPSTSAERQRSFEENREEGKKMMENMQTLKRINEIERPLNSVPQHMRHLTESLGGDAAIWLLTSLMLPKAADTKLLKDSNPLMEALHNYQLIHIEAYIVYVDVVSQYEVAFKLTTDTIDTLVEYHKDIYSVDVSTNTWSWPEKGTQLKKMHDEFVQAANCFVFYTDIRVGEGLEEEGVNELLEGRSEDVKSQIMNLFVPLLPPPPRVVGVLSTQPLPEITANIIPSEGRDDQSKDELRSLARHLDDFQELPIVI